MRHHYQISKWNGKGGQKNHKTGEEPMVTKQSNAYCDAHSVESYCKESNISDRNWLIYLFFIIFDGNWVET